MKLAKYSVLLTPLLVWLMFQSYLIRPPFFYVSTFFAIFFVAFSVWLIFRIRYKCIEQKKCSSLFLFLAVPTLLTLSSAVYSLIIINSFARQALFALDLVFVYAYLRIFFYYINESKYYKENSFQNVLLLGVFLAMFFMFASIYGLKMFLGFSMSIWPMVIISIPLTFILAEAVMHSQGISLADDFLYLMIFCLVLVELMWSISFLPLSHVSIGMIMAVFCYLMVDLIKLRLLDSLTGRIFRIYLIFGILSFLFIILTAKWM